MTAFDPETGKLIIPREDLLSVGLYGKGMRVPKSKVVNGNKVTEVVHEDDGGTAGTLTEHNDGSVAANVFARAKDVTATHPILSKQGA